MCDNMDLKDIELDGVRLKYKIFHHFSEYGENSWTEFYIGSKTIIRKKYVIFGKKIKKEIPFKVFEFNINIEDPSYTKEDIRGRLSDKLKLVYRKSEILRGEII